MQLPPGTTVGRYRIVASLGSGGMGEVYRAEDLQIRREVAIKLVRPPARAHGDVFRRFEKEVQAAGQLNHPNIVGIFDVGFCEGVPYLVTELLEGETLGAKLRHGPLAPRKALDHAVQIANGLAAAHDKGVIHRDLKPNNLFVTRDGQVKILDFGIAKLIERGDAHAHVYGVADAPTTEGTILGTESYMSPEQIRGAPTDHRSDIFSFGIVLYEMLTGRRAFQRATVWETMSATLNDDLRVDLPDTAPTGLDTIIERCIEKAPENRYQSTRDLAFGLAVLAGQRALPVGVRRARPARPVAMVAVAAACLVASILVGAFVASRLAASPSPPVYQQLTFRRGQVLSARFAPDGHTIVYGAGWQGRPFELYSMRPDSPESRRLDFPPADILSISSTGEMAISLGRRYGVGFARTGTLARVPLGGGAAREVLTNVDDADWSPDGTMLAAAHVVDGKYRLEYPIGTLLYETDGWISHLRVSPDGRHVAFMDHPILGDDRGTVSVVARDGQRKVLTSSWASANGLAWAPDGREIWFTGSERGPNCALYAIDLRGLTRSITRSLGRLTIQDIDRAGRVLLTEGRFRIGMSYRRSADQLETDLSWLDVSIANDLSGDGLVLFTEHGDGAGTDVGAVYRRAVDESAAIRLGEGSLAALSPDGEWAAVVSDSDPGVTLLPTGAGIMRRLPSGTIAEYQAIAWFPDGRRLLLTGKERSDGIRLYLQDVADGPPRPFSAAGVRTLPYSNPISPDGGRIAALDRGGNVVLLPADGGSPLAVAGLTAGDVPVRWSPDGTALYVYRKGELPAQVHRLDLQRTHKEFVAEIAPADSAGMSGITSLLVTPDGTGFLYSYSQTLSALYLAAGLR